LTHLQRFRAFKEIETPLSARSASAPRRSEPRHCAAMAGACTPAFALVSHVAGSRLRAGVLGVARRSGPPCPVNG